ncbi:type III-B CRISPR-associated protein Cas10/Cmr2 [Gemmata sp. JC673]|uniref:Type III-B CRISPR-associated protein Cas10/Cmr2 n=1 Tax=Gemmata algarum TaxID=2975278 RepID=A0ABU5FAY5_9BACT|nr:type III-B CRISPR-associated protein Cas10/Cmr2 [Gemmata algarum]MDY3562991.1 type III-B CRISPR-associated protein Cas10/Cmr2 [Gemmata algarum]
MSTALLSFKLGPVQPFIEAARTIRDLWSGSYLLSWLTAHGIKALFDGTDVKPGVTFVTPDTNSSRNPLLRAVIEGEKGNNDATLACLPHTFAAEVPAAEAATMRDAILNSVSDEWKRIAARVKKAIDPHFQNAAPCWDENWQVQIDSYFEFTCVVLPLDGLTHEVLDQLPVERDDSQGSDPAAQLWGRCWNLLGGLLDATRSVRHVPRYTPDTRGGKCPVKCSLLGSFEQMGPADFNGAQKFWEQVSTPNWSGISGTRLQSKDKFCAISLVKRFAWAVYWSAELNLKPAALRYSDTPTMAAKKWLAEEEVMALEMLRDEHGAWNGQWLHWSRDEPGKGSGDPKRPAGLKGRIDAKSEAQGAPPTYYALLHLDGDNMGDVFQGSTGAQFGNGIERFQQVTKRLTDFAQNDVKRIVTECCGELIYAGGDDVLAFLPTETAIECAGRLRKAFEHEQRLPGATLSGGIAVVHWKEDLRFALGQVRAAEKQAKRIGTKYGNAGVKDALAVTVCKRSGEHTTAVMGWPETAQLQDLIRQFQVGASDRWAYKLSQELETLVQLPAAAGRAELFRLVDRGEYPNKAAFRETVEKLFNGYEKQMTSEDRKWLNPDVLSGFVTLMQTASFLARGSD